MNPAENKILTTTVPFLTREVAFPPPATEDRVKQLTTEGWRIVADGPDGVKLEKKGQLRMRTKVCLVLGGVLLVAWGAGAILILLALFDYYKLTSPETVVIPR